MSLGNTIIWMRILEARNLYSGFNGSNNYVTVRLKGHSKTLFETKPWSRGVGVPLWNEEFNFVSARPNKDVVVIRVYDIDIHGHSHLIGKANIPVAQYLGRGMVDQWFVLTPRRSHSNLGALGDVHVQFLCGGLPSSYGFMAEPASLPTLQTTTLWVPAAVPYVPVSTSTVQTPPVPAPRVLPQMPSSGHTSVATKTFLEPVMEKPALAPVTMAPVVAAPAVLATPVETTTFYTPAAQTYIPRSH